MDTIRPAPYRIFLQNAPEITRHIDGERPSSAAETPRDIEPYHIEKCQCADSECWIPSLPAVLEFRGTVDPDDRGERSERHRTRRAAVPAKGNRKERRRHPPLDSLAQPAPPHELVKLVTRRARRTAQKYMMLRSDGAAAESARGDSMQHQSRRSEWSL